MSFLVRSAARKAFPAVARPLIARRGFAEAVPADKLRLSLALPYTVSYLFAQAFDLSDSVTNMCIDPLRKL